MNSTDTQNDSSKAFSERIFLIGFMGSGKSHWGKIWATRRQYNFLDLDDVLEQEEQSSVIDIFEKKGEDYFRQKEAIMLRTLHGRTNMIVACGGGTACFFDNVSWMKNAGTVVFLEAPPATILKNILTQEAKRPLVKNLNEAELLFFVEQKLKDRSEFYTQAHHTWQVEELTDASIDTLIPNK